MTSNPLSADASLRPPVLIGLDWGSSSLRAYLFAADGTVLARDDTGLGVLNVSEGRFRQTFETVCADWLAQSPDLPVIACGMIGSRQGWREAPYAHTPAGFSDIAACLTSLDDDAGRVFRLIPGVQFSGGLGAHDVMRGEETQVFGALSAASLLTPTDAAHRDGLFLLPGTHCKWVEVRGHRIVALRSYLTGETYSLLRHQSILGRLCADPAPDDEHAQALALKAFDIGVTQAHAQPGALLHLLFLVRTEGLFQRFQPTQLPAYLSGLLLGAEIADAAAWCGAELPPTLIGAPAIVARYARALHVLGLPARIAAEECTAEGLFAIGSTAGLLANPS